MADVAVYQPTFGRGGMEAVCMNVLEALQTEHELTLLTLEDPDLDALNNYFDAEVKTPVPIRHLGGAGRVVQVTHRLSSNVGNGLGRLHASAYGRLIRSAAADYDLLVSTFGEFAFDHPSVQYVHFPVFNRCRLAEETMPRGRIRRAYDWTCDVVSGHHRRTPGTHATLLANSDWTAGVVEAVHGVMPETVYPPVDTGGFEPTAWSERDPGFVTIGRVAPEKRTHVVVDIVQQLHREGYDLPLRVVGPVGDETYYRRLHERTRDDDLIHFEGAVSRERLVELVSTHRYGIHGMRNEHFGIAVAELVAGGVIPFVPDGGGQREIVDQTPHLCYESVDDAARKITAVVDDPEEQRRIRERLPDVEARFGRSRFRREFREAVANALAGA